MLETELPIEMLEDAIRASRKHNRPIVAYSNELRILSESRPILKRDGTQLILSTGPVYGRDYLWVAYIDNDSWKWDAP